MSKKTKTALTLIISLIIVGIIAFLFFYKNKDGVSGLRILFPFGQGPGNIPEARPVVDDDKGDKSGQVDSNRPPKLFQIHKTPVAGSAPFEIISLEGMGKTAIRYIERGLGHIYETEIETMKKTRISNTTRLKIYEALWGDDGKNTVIRYLDNKNNDTIRSFLIKLPNDINDEVTQEEDILTEKNIETEGLFLPKNISDITTSPDSEKVFYLIDKGDLSIGNIYNTISDESKQIFSSEFTEWLPQWPNENLITLTTKPSGTVPGILYSLNAETNEMTREIGDVKGLTTLTNPEGTKVLYSESTRSGFTLNLYNLTSHTSKKLPLTTLPEKCIWDKISEDIVYCGVPKLIPNKTYPDVWYQGSISFSDELWAINVESGRTTLILDPKMEAREDMDIINPALSEGGGFFFFRNKKDLSLWGARLFAS